MLLEARDETAVVLDPREEAFDSLPAAVPAQGPPILRDVATD